MDKSSLCAGWISAPPLEPGKFARMCKECWKDTLRTESRPIWECIVRMLVHSATHVCAHVWVVLKARLQCVSACALIRVQAHRAVFGLQVCVCVRGVRCSFMHARCSL